ncbi:hypothetical protein MUY21_11550 [Aliiroseovarius sp. S2029]|uniref:hypothetical protein n=1 Tax=Aliiroseovarius sp. S2029 TaxID=2936988 RepID=UPI0020BE885E|nr:hypothetical protein [Aliiroseovarius sp. S2029]MCK8484671.1 hypothetical protein [Aliiroseovarius sp. S2029]
MHTATYFENENFLLVRCTAHVHFASLIARVAEWIITIDAPKGRLVLVDLRDLRTIDRPNEGPLEYVQMQKKLSRDYHFASKVALLAPQPEAFVLARIFEQSAQGRISTEMDVFRSGAEALSYLGIAADDVDLFIQTLGDGRPLD